jgi:Type II CAAX prenyl endopeptidase Rce1-like
VLLAFTVALVAISIPAGAYAIFSGTLSNTTSSATPFHPYFWIGPIAVVSTSYASAGVLFVGVTAVYVAMLVYAVFQQRRPWNAVSDSVKKGVSALDTSPFIVMMIAISFLTFTSSVIDDVTASAGVPIGGPSGDPLLLFLGFTYAPLVEEIGFRVVLIGLVALILSFGRPLREALGALWRPSKAIEGLAVGSGASIIIWVATGLSAVTFGACHVICGGSEWQIGKFPEAAFGGLVLGFLYVRYGFHVAVITHWGIDFFGSALAFFGQAAYGIPWNSATTEYIGQYLVDIDMLFLLGLASFLLVVYLVVKRLTQRRAPVYGGADLAPPAGTVLA